MMYIKLSEMKVGSSGIVRSFENTTTSIKLMEMGCVPGEKIKVDTRTGEYVERAR